MYKRSFICDVPGCNKEHTVNNGFFVVKVVKPFKLQPATGLSVQAFTEKAAEKYPVVCGETCLHTWISQNLGRLNETSVS